MKKFDEEKYKIMISESVKYHQNLLDSIVIKEHKESEILKEWISAQTIWDFLDNVYSSICPDNFESSVREHAENIVTKTMEEYDLYDEEDAELIRDFQNETEDLIFKQLDEPPKTEEWLKNHIKKEINDNNNRNSSKRNKRNNTKGKS